MLLVLGLRADVRNAICQNCSRKCSFSSALSEAQMFLGGALPQFRVHARSLVCLHPNFNVLLADVTRKRLPDDKNYSFLQQNTSVITSPPLCFMMRWKPAQNDWPQSFCWSPPGRTSPSSVWSHVVIIIVYSDGEVWLLMVSERAPGASEMGGYTFRQAVISTVSKCFFFNVIFVQAI